MQHALTFGAHEIKVINREGQVWMSSLEIGRALEYANPEKAVTTLYRLRSDEFTDSMTKLFRVATAGGKQAVRFFSLRGAHLLAMFARTPVAKAFRVWVLDILDNEAPKHKPAKQCRYYYPLDSCKPPATGDVFDNQAQFGLSGLTDPKNPTPELDLLEHLERDGHDVTGARVRILAMRQQLVFMLMTNKRLGVWAERLEKMIEEFGNYQRDAGAGALFGREPQGLSRLSFSTQLPGWRHREKDCPSFKNGEPW
jgi:hypothetical protein